MILFGLYIVTLCAAHPILNIKSEGAAYGYAVLCTLQYLYELLLCSHAGTGEAEDDDIAVEKLLNSNSTVCGTVLHLATKVR